MLIALSALCLTLAVEPGHVKRILDGDTFAVWHLDIGGEVRIRVLDVDAPERGQSGYVEATDFTRAWLARGPFSLWACERDSFGRLLARIQRGQTTLADDLVAVGLARWR